MKTKERRRLTGYFCVQCSRIADVAAYGLIEPGKEIKILQECESCESVFAFKIWLPPRRERWVGANEFLVKQAIVVLKIEHAKRKGKKRK